jgi:hypothetical protein
MPLTPEEQQELAQLQTKYAPKQQGGLTPAEQAELAQLHQKFGGQSDSQPRAGSVIDAYKSGGLSKAYDALKGNVGAYDKFQNQNPIQSQGPMSTLMKMGVTPVGGLAALSTDGLGVLGRASTNAGSAGLQKYLSNLVSGNSDRTQGVGGAMALGGGGSLALDTASAGAGKLADWLQQAASGMTKYKPGIGTNLINQGVWGTKNGMANQVADMLPAKEQEVQQAVAGIKGNADAQDIGDAISRVGNKFKMPSTGDVSPGMDSYAQKVNDASDAYQSMGEGGELTPQDLLTAKRQGDWLGYTNSGTPATSLEAEIGQEQADKARSMLSDMSEGETAKKLADEQALILAKKALTKPDSIPNGLGAKAIFMKAPGQSLFGSMAAQGLQKGVAAPAGAIADPELMQTLFGLSNASSAK